jgi:hypothetical protein
MSLDLFCVGHATLPVALPDSIKLIGVAGFDAELSDSTGDSISERNARWSELTAIYWIIKNAARSGTFTGVCHYRRFWFAPSKPYRLAQHPYLPFLLVDPAEFDQVTADASRDRMLSRCAGRGLDVLMPKPLRLDTSVHEQFRTGHPGQDGLLIAAIQLAVRKNYVTKAFAQYFLQQPELFICNMSIMKTEIFVDIWEKIFGLLFEIEDTAPEFDDWYQNRTFGFLGERLLSMLVMAETWQAVPKWRMATSNVLMVDTRGPEAGDGRDRDPSLTL